MKRFKKKKKNKTRNYELLNNSIGVKDKDRFNEFSQDNEFQWHNGEIPIFTYPFRFQISYIDKC